MSCSLHSPSLLQNAPARLGVEQREDGTTRKPSWLKVKLPTSPVFQSTTDLVRDLRLNTVCEEAKCPNRWECWSRGSATIMIAGQQCTRACKFCAVGTARPGPLEADEPERVAEAAVRMGLRHIVITMVARDDLPDGAAGHVARTIKAVRRAKPGIVVEVLVSDFQGRLRDVEMVVDAGPDIYNHNVETVRRLTPTVRHRATYDRSLMVLAHVKALNSRMVTKSGIMLGLGETGEEIRITLQDIRSVGCEIVTLGQYLQPNKELLPVKSWVTPEEFEAWEIYAKSLGYRYVASGPLVRSSYYADAVRIEQLASSS